MKTRGHAVLIIVAMLSGVVGLGWPARAAGQGKEFVDKKNGYRLQLPPGWSKGKNNVLTDAMASFYAADKNLMVTIHREPLPHASEEYLLLLERHWVRTFPACRKASQEEAVLGGLPARKLIFRCSGENYPPVQFWLFTALTPGDYWLVTALGPDPALVVPQDPRSQQIEQLLNSFEFLEPVLSRLKAASKGRASLPPAQHGARYYINDQIGIRILLPAGWELTQERGGVNGEAPAAELGRPGTLASIYLGWQAVEATAELYKKLVLAELSGREAFRLISEKKVTRGGLPLTQFIYEVSDASILYRCSVEILSVDREHIRVSACAPGEVFARYAEAFEQIQGSAQFPRIQAGVEEAKKAAESTRQTSSSPVGENPERSSTTPPAVLEDLRAKVAQAPYDAPARFELGKALQEHGDLRGAVAQFAECVRLAPGHTEALWQLGAAQMLTGDSKAAEATLRTLVRRQPDHLEAQNALAIALVAQGELEKAADEWQSLIRRDRRKAGVLGQVVPDGDQARALSGELIEEWREFERASEEAAAQMVVARMCQIAGNESQAIKSLQKALRLDPRLALAHQMLSALHADQQRWPEAMTAAQAALQLNPSLPWAHVFLGAAYEATARETEAQAEYQAAIRLAPSLPQAYIRLGALHMSQGREAEAIVSFEKALSSNPEQRAVRESHSYLALAYLTRGQFPLAWQHVRAVERAGGLVSAELLEALIKAMPESKMQELQGKALRLQKEAEQKPEDFDLRLRYAEVLSEMGDLESALSEYESISRVANQLSVPHWKMGRIHMALRRNRDSEREFLEAIRLAPQDGDAFLDLAELYYHHDKREKESLEAYEKGLERKPDADPHYWNNAAWLYATAQDVQLRNSAKAIEYSTKAVEKTKGIQASYLDTLAEANFISCRFDEAITTEKKAIALRPQDTFLRQQLAKYQNAQKRGACAQNASKN